MTFDPCVFQTFTGPYVYNLKSVVSDGELRTLMRIIGYGCDRDSHFRLQEPPGGAAAAAHLRQLAFELFLAQAECRLLGEVVSLARGSASELEALQLRRGCRDDAAGCADALRRRDSLGADVARLAVRPADAERPHAYHLRRSGRPSKSVDVTDGAGHWHGGAACRPVLKASLSLRKEPLLVDAEEDEKDEILRPPPAAATSLFSVAPPPSSYGASAVDFFPPQAPPTLADAHSTAYQLASLDEMDLYTERGGGGGPAGGRQTPSSRLRDGWLLKGHSGVQCQGCGGGCPASSPPCRRCDGTLCPACHHLDPAPCCAPPQELHPRAQRPLIRDKLSVYAHPPHPLTLGHAHPQSLAVAKLFPNKTTGGSGGSAVGLAKGGGGGGELLNLGPRCGFCDMPAASHTCLGCSKVSCGTCYSLYSFDTCSRKNPQHSFVPNDQLNFKSSTMSHLVFR